MAPLEFVEAFLFRSGSAILASSWLDLPLLVAMGLCNLYLDLKVCGTMAFCVLLLFVVGHFLVAFGVQVHLYLEVRDCWGTLLLHDQCGYGRRNGLGTESGEVGQRASCTLLASSKLFVFPNQFRHVVKSSCHDGCCVLRDHRLRP